MEHCHRGVGRRQSNIKPGNGNPRGVEIPHGEGPQVFAQKASGYLGFVAVDGVTELGEQLVGIVSHGSSSPTRILASYSREHLILV